MSVFFSADCHFNHSAILKYCERPFKNIDHMNEELVRRWNNRVSPDDTVYHLGDFSFGSRKKWESKLNGKVVHVGGNHDKGLKLLGGIMQFGGKQVFVVHNPATTFNSIISCDFVLCGHVHNNWRVKIEDEVMFLNVGVDQWNFEPVGLKSVLKMVDKYG